ncbi:MAG: PilC/PilY family type IV pilus protein [Pseudomonadota bacterium]
MKALAAFRHVSGVLGCILMLMPFGAGAEDIDVFIGKSAGSTDAPNVIFLIDNSPNWSRASQQWPDDSGNQGESELLAISEVLDLLAVSDEVNIGLALLTEYAGSTASGATPGNGGGYLRFGARDMSVAANKTALKNILAKIRSNVNDPKEKLGGMPKKEEAAAFYELYKYFSNLAPYTGPLASNPWADVNLNGGDATHYTAYGQGMTSGFAINSDGKYQSTVTKENSCARNFIIYIANNANNSGFAGRSSYQASVANVGSTQLPLTGGESNWVDEWAKYLYSNGVRVEGEEDKTRSVVTYVLDAYNKQQNVAYSKVLQNTARVGGGRYFQVGNKAAIKAALLTIMAEIKAVNTTFASASLPVNTTNRSQNRNQVFISMFRPDQEAEPVWMGNLKQYKVIFNPDDETKLELGDVAGEIATSTTTGFFNDCALSFWTTDSGNYWESVPINPVPKGTCPTTSYNAFSDAPDGSFVEKGGVAEVIRKGNNPPSTNTTPTWAVNRTIYTLAGSSLTAFNTTTSSLSASVVDFIQGKDVNDEDGDGNVSETRPTLHGDSIHSRPLPIDYGDAGVTVYYGSNDGTLRAVDSTTGRERWAFIAPEFFSRLGRLQANSPLVKYPGMSSSITPAPTPKDYFFDGSVGGYQNLDNSKVWIYPTMRRGGRMIYAFDVTNPASPSFKWKAGCPNLTNDTGCSSGMSGIGQTWSRPNVARIKGYSNETPVVVVGGGYDACEDANTATPSCASPKGAGVYLFDASNGTPIKTFTTLRSVAADVALLDVNNDNMADYAFLSDTGGNIYRISFTRGPSTAYSELAPADWEITRIAYTNGAGRKFLYPPAMAQISGGNVYLAIGSGDREHPLISDYPYNNVENRFYVLLHNLASTTAVNLDSGDAMYDYTSSTGCDAAGVKPGSGKMGWYMKLNQYGQGEQTVTSALITAGMVAFSTNRPIPAAEGSCENSLGEARGYWVNLLNASGSIGAAPGSCGGVRSSKFIGGGIVPSPVKATVEVDGKSKTFTIGTVDPDTQTDESPVSPNEPKPGISSERSLMYWKSSGDN